MVFTVSGGALQHEDMAFSPLKDNLSHCKRIPLANSSDTGGNLYAEAFVIQQTINIDNK